MESVVAVILAAGKGTRMRSRMAKVLHPLLGQPMLEHVIESVEAIGISRIVTVVGHQADLVRQTIGSRVEYVVQEEQLGTGHAVMQAASVLKDHVGPVLVTHGDTPLYRPETFRKLVENHKRSGAEGTLLSATMADPHGYGRVVRDQGTGNADGGAIDHTVGDRAGRFQAVVEQKDITSPEIDRITEINTGTYCFEAPLLFDALGGLHNDNRQGEYYLPDVLEIFTRQGRPVAIHRLDDGAEALGINDRRQLAAAEKVLQQRVLDRWMLSGVRIIDPESTIIHGDVTIGSDTVIWPFTVIQGPTTIGQDCQIGPSAVLRQATIDDGAVIGGAVVEQSHVGARAVVESFVNVRQGSRVAADQHVTTRMDWED